MTMTGLHVSAELSRTPVSRTSRRGLVGIPPAVQEIALRRVIARSEEFGDPLPAEVTGILLIVVASVMENQLTPGAVVDARAQTDIGRRLIEVIREEVTQCWRVHGIHETDLPMLLLAIERVREAVANGDAESFATSLGGNDGVSLLVEVAHDMHSPLNSILFLAETLQRGGSGPVTDMQRRQLGLICTAALGLSSVGSDIIDFTRSDKLLEPRPVPFSVTTVLEAVRDIVRPMAEVKNLTVSVEPPEIDERLGHPVALRRVLLNLTTNALKFTEQGTVNITARETRQGWLEFAVRDSGRGIDAAAMPTLFHPVRVAPQRDPDERRGNKLFSNTGLGLMICRKLAGAMGSQLRVETQLGRGTRFFFELELPECPSRRSSDAERRKATSEA